jgi:hypothetical protein
MFSSHPLLSDEVSLKSLIISLFEFINAVLVEFAAQ